MTENYVTFNRDTLEFDVIALDREDISGFLNAAYAITNSRTVDVARVMADGLSAWVDDEGLYTQGDKLSMVGDYPQPLAGGILFSGGADEEGYTVGVPDAYIADDFAALRAIVMPLYVQRGGYA